MALSLLISTISSKFQTLGTIPQRSVFPVLKTVSSIMHDCILLPNRLCRRTYSRLRDCFRYFCTWTFHIVLLHSRHWMYLWHRRRYCYRSCLHCQIIISLQRDLSSASGSKAYIRIRYLLTAVNRYYKWHGSHDCICTSQGRLKYHMYVQAVCVLSISKEKNLNACYETL